MKFNKPKRGSLRTRIENYEGGEAFETETPEMGLYKLTINNLLENTFYRSDEDALYEVMGAFQEFLNEKPEEGEFILKLAEYARDEMYLRQIPQLLLVLSANTELTKEYVRDYSPRIMQRADEPAEAIAMQLDLFGKPIPKPLKKGIADALHNFDEYQFSKYSGKNKEVSMIDVINLVHPEPEDEEHEEIFKRVIKGGLDDYEEIESLEPPETWEVIISEKGSTAEAWREVLPRMGLFAKIRNLRNMKEEGLRGEEILTEEDLEYVRDSKIYPFRFYQAHKALLFEGIQDEWLQDWLSSAIDAGADTLDDELGDTFVGADLSGSMDSYLSGRSSMTYKEISALLGAVLKRKGAGVGAFASDYKLVRAHHRTPTLEIADKILHLAVGGSTNGWKVLKDLNERGESYDRVIILTDMQIWDSSTGFRRDSHTIREEFTKYRENVNPDVILYMVDLSSYGQLTTPESYEDVYNISGWNDRIFDYISSIENKDQILKEIKAT